MNNPATSPANAPDTKTCPFCAETIKAEALVCRCCGRTLPPPSVQGVRQNMRRSFVPPREPRWLRRMNDYFRLLGWFVLLALLLWAWRALTGG